MMATVTVAFASIVEDRPMFELAIAVIAATSLSIFLVHAIEAYLTH
jgi:hypothetical protein